MVSGGKRGPAGAVFGGPGPGGAVLGPIWSRRNGINFLGVFYPFFMLEARNFCFWLLYEAFNTELLYNFEIIMYVFLSFAYPVKLCALHFLLQALK